MQWATKLWESTVSFAKKAVNNLGRLYDATLNRLKNIGTFSSYLFKLEPRIAFKLFVDSDGKLITDGKKIDDIFTNTFAFAHDINKVVDLNKVKETIQKAGTQPNFTLNYTDLFGTMNNHVNPSNGNIVAKALKLDKSPFVATNTFLGGAVLWANYDETGDGVVGDVYKPDLDFSGEPVEAFAAGKDKLVEYLEKAKTHSRLLEAESEKISKVLKGFDKLVKESIQDANNPEAKKLVKGLKVKLATTNKFVNHALSTMSLVNTYANKVIESAKKEETKEK